MTCKIKYPVDINRFIKTQGFGENPEAYSKFKPGGVALKGHNGDDWAPRIQGNYDALAVHDGTVKKIGWDASGYGNYVILTHKCDTGIEQFDTLYAHLAGPPVVHSGDRVSAGQKLGTVGSTGNSSGPHLHFELRPSTSYAGDGWGGAVDPVSWYDALGGSVISPPITFTSSVHAGKVKITAPSGVNVRTDASVLAKSLCIAPFGTEVEALDETKKQANVTFRAVKVWIAESQGDMALMQNS